MIPLKACCSEMTAKRSPLFRQMASFTVIVTRNGSSEHGRTSMVARLRRAKQVALPVQIQPQKGSVDMRHAMFSALC